MEEFAAGEGGRDPPPPPPPAAAEAIGAPVSEEEPFGLIPAGEFDMQRLASPPSLSAAGVVELSGGHVELLAGESAGRDHRVLDPSPPPHPAAAVAVVELIGEEVGEKLVDEVAGGLHSPPPPPVFAATAVVEPIGDSGEEVELSGGITADEVDGGDVQGLDSPSPPSAAALTAVAASTDSPPSPCAAATVTAADEAPGWGMQALDSPPPCSVAFTDESIGEAIGTLSLEEEVAEPIAVVEVVGRDRLVLDVGEEMGDLSLEESVELIAGIDSAAWDMQALAVPIGDQSSEEPEEMSGLISADEGEGRDKLELDSPPPPSAAADVELSGEKTGTLSLEEEPGEVTGSIAAVESVRRDVEELHVPEENEGEECEMGEILELICDDESAGPQLPSSAAAGAESIGEDVGTVSLEEEPEAAIKQITAVEMGTVSMEENAGEDELGLDSPPPTASAVDTEEVRSPGLEEGELEGNSELSSAEESGGPDKLEESEETLPSFDAANFESMGEEFATIGLEEELAEVTETVAPVEMGTVSEESEEQVSAEENTGGDELGEVEESEEPDAANFESMGEEFRTIGLEEELAEVTEPIAPVEMGTVSEEPEEPRSAEENAGGDELGEVEENSELIPVVESAEGNQVLLDCSPPLSFATASESMGEELESLSLEELFEEESKRVGMDQLGLDLSPSTPAVLESIREEMRNLSLEGELMEMAVLAPAGEIVMRGSCPPALAAFESMREELRSGSLEGELVEMSKSIAEEMRKPGLEEGELEETFELIPTTLESIAQEMRKPSLKEGELEETFELIPATLESIAQEMRKPSLEEGELEEMLELIPLAVESLDEEMRKPSLEEGKLEEVSELIFAAVESIAQEMREPSLEEGELEEISELIPSDVESIAEEMRKPSLEEGQLDEISELIPSDVESIAEEMRKPSLEEGELEETSKPISAALESIAEEMRKPSLEEGELEEMSEPISAALESIAEEMRKPSLEEGELEEISELTSLAVESIAEEMRKPSLEEGELEEISELIPSAVESIAEEMRKPSLEEGELEEMSEPVCAALESIAEEMRKPSLEEGGLEEMSEPICAALESIAEEMRKPSLEEGELEEVSEPIPAALESIAQEMRKPSLEEGELEEMSEQIPATLESIAQDMRKPSLEEGELEEMSELIPADEIAGQDHVELDSSRPSSTLAVGENIRNKSLSVPISTNVSMSMNQDDANEDYPQRPDENVGSSGDANIELLKCKRLEILANQEMGLEGYVNPEVKFEGADTSVQATGWGQYNADHQDHPSFGEKGGWLETPKPVEVTGWVEDAATWNAEDDFKGGADHGKTGFEYSASVAESTAWKDGVNPDWKDGANQEGFASFDDGGRGEWSQSGDYEGTKRVFTSVNEKTVWEYNASVAENIGWGSSSGWKDGAYGGTEHGSASLDEKTGWGYKASVAENTSWNESLKNGGYQGAASIKNAARGELSEGGGEYGSSESGYASSEYPERPGEPDCSYYIRTGNCQYGSRCKYNHPPNRNRHQAILGPGLKQGSFSVSTAPGSSHDYVSTDPLLSTPGDKLSQGLKVTFRLLCPDHKVGGIIGKGGMIVKQFEAETGAFIRFGARVEESEERTITVTASENPNETSSRAQNAVVRVFRRSMEVGFRERAEGGLVSARLLVQANKIPSLMGKDGEKLEAISSLSGASIQVLVGDQIPRCASSNEEVVQIDGELANVQDALIRVTSRLRDSFFSAVCGTGTGAYPNSRERLMSPILPTSQGHPMSESGNSGSISIYNHGQYQKESEIGQVKLNSLGFPLRPGGNICFLYMRTGSCKYTANCKFHHPEQDPSGYASDRSTEQHAPVSKPRETSQFSKTSNKPILSNASLWTMLFPPQRTSPSDWNDYQAPVTSSASNLRGHLSQKDGPIQGQVQMEDYTGGMDQPEYQHPRSSAFSAPSQADHCMQQQAQMDYAEGGDPKPNCPYFMTFGTCKSGSSCQYLHSRTTVSNMADQYPARVH